MHHGCYKLCPKVREQQRKAREDHDKSRTVVSSSYEIIEDAAGPSGLQNVNSRLNERRGKNVRSVKNPQNPRDKNEDKTKRVYSSESYESLNSREGKTYNRDYSRKSCECLGKRGDEKANSTGRDSRKYANKSEALSREKRRKQEEIYTSGQESRKIDYSNSPRKIHGNNRTERKNNPIEGKSDDKNLRIPEKSRKKDEAGPSRIADADNNLRDNCDRNCDGINEKIGKSWNGEEQETLDEYIVNKSLCYFEDLCNCHYACLIDQLWKDSFVKSTIASTIIFAIGLKLCFEMDGWRISF